MEGLTTEHVLIAMLAALCASMFVVVALLFQREARRHIHRWEDRRIGRDEALLLAYMVDRNPMVLRQVRASTALRGRLVRLAAPIQGDEKTVLTNAYVALGFAYEDFKTLRGRSLTGMTKAMQRCRKLEVALPEDIWTRLLGHSNVTLRWGAMEYLIFMRKKDSFLSLMWFLRQPRNRRRGMALHLSACFAKVAPNLLPRILDYVDDAFLKEVWLHALAVYPVPGSEGSLLALAQSLETTLLLPAAIRAVAALPCDATLLFLTTLVRHHDGVVKHAVAQALAGFAEPAAVEALAELAMDTSFEIRAQAVDSLFVNEEVAAAAIASISASGDHPSHLLVQRAKIGVAA